MAKFPNETGPVGGTTTFQGNLGGMSNVWQAADATLTRPGNTTPYTTGMALGSAASTVFRFGTFFRQPAGSGLLTGARLVASVSGIGTANMGAITGHVFNATPSAAPAADQSQFPTLAADDAAKLGTISFSTWAIGGTGSNLIESYGVLSLSPLPVIAAPITNSVTPQELFVVLMAAGGWTPVSAAILNLYLAAVLD